MSASLLIPGNAETVDGQAAPYHILECDTPLDLTSVTKMLVLVKLQAVTVNAVSFNIVISNRSSNSGLNNYRLLTNTIGDLRTGWRTSTVNAPLTATVVAAADTTNVNIVGSSIDLTAQQVKHYKNGVQEGSTYQSAGSAWNFPRVFLPTLQGYNTNGKDWIFYEMPVWVDVLPTDADILAYYNGTALGALSVPPTRVYKPVGANGTYVASIPDDLGASTLDHVQGPALDGLGDPVEDALQIIADTEILTNQGQTVTARTVLLSADSSEATGDYYIIGDISSVFGGVPTGPNIENGFADDGVTETAIFRTVSAVGETGFVETIDELNPNIERKFYAVQKYGSEYSNVLEWTVSTKRPVVRPTGAEPFVFSASDVLLETETGISLKIGAAYTETGLATEADGSMEVDFSDALTSANGFAQDIGDTITFLLTRTNGEKLYVENAVLIDGDA